MKPPGSRFRKRFRTRPRKSHKLPQRRDQLMLLHRRTRTRDRHPDVPGTHYPPARDGRGSQSSRHLTCGCASGLTCQAGDRKSGTATNSNLAGIHAWALKARTAPQSPRGVVIGLVSVFPTGVLSTLSISRTGEPAGSPRWSVLAKGKLPAKISPPLSTGFPLCHRKQSLR